MTSQGMLKSYSPATKWGFITMDGQDIFFHKNDVKGRPPKEGDVLTFNLVPSEKQAGKMVAKEIEGGTLGGTLEGTVKWYCPWKGYGYIDIGEESHFVHHSDVLAKEEPKLLEGQTVWFDIGASPKDESKTVCKNVVGGPGGKDTSGYGGGYGKMGDKGMGKAMANMMQMMMTMGPYGGGKGKGGGDQGGMGGKSMDKGGMGGK
eukprot:CAMPEP_0197656476 /NCGR_PEP_ID=MMETSP1338-20131121/42021_1 /TAXON_ID=43686 ORGANISM="Pelagodinium beii, Strain RCC1491" /NCGR_SAMPLE_ID=MMETSP1338 /ASSEMBLY_ACC=CAM_ASM_000754 /LENGTH=203 /DNA_ID=CAMNT_0043232489 /DNA_START=58 /DNA_END=666 /DNA_ORIENTATION=-